MSCYYYKNTLWTETISHGVLEETASSFSKHEIQEKQS
jgi:hypothetical protein